MGAKDSKPSCISYEDAIKRGEWKISCVLVMFFSLFKITANRKQIINETEKKKQIAFDLIIGSEHCVTKERERDQKMKRIEKKKTQTCLDCKLKATIVHDSDHMNRINCEWVSEWASTRMKTKQKQIQQRLKKFTFTTYQMRYISVNWHSLIYFGLCACAPFYCSSVSFSYEYFQQNKLNRQTRQNKWKGSI